MCKSIISRVNVSVPQNMIRNVISLPALVGNKPFVNLSICAVWIETLLLEFRGHILHTCSRCRDARREPLRKPEIGDYRHVSVFFGSNIFPE